MTPLSILKDSLSADHKEFYIQLQYFLLQLAKLMLVELKELIKYIKEILETHFRQEEESFFNQLVEIKPESKELITSLLEDHKAIKIKLTALEKTFLKFQGAYELGVSDGSDYKQNLLFPAYNLIGTINHHAEREDREIFKDFC